MTSLYRLLFWLLCFVGAPIHGIRPRRMYHWVARRGFREPPAEDQFRWYRDRWGFRFQLHPYYWIDRNVIAFGAYETDLLDFLHTVLRPGMICLDVGAHFGQVAVHMGGLVGPAGRVHAFEPIPRLLVRLRSHVRANGLEKIVSGHGTAISDAEGVARLQVPDDAAENQGVGSLVSRSAGASSEQIEVTTIRLDDFVARCGIDRLDLMKIDIQGAEPLLLKGAQETLKDLRPDILIEVSPADLRSVDCDSRELLEMIEAHGYSLFEFGGSRRLRPFTARSVASDYEAAAVYCTRRTEATKYSR